MTKWRIKVLVLLLIFATIVTVGYEYGLYYIGGVVKVIADFEIVLRIFLTILVFVIFLSVFLRSDNFYTKLPWLIVLLINPVFGVFLFLTFANNYKNTFRYRKRAGEIEKFKYLKLKNDGDYQSELLNDESITVQEIYKTSYMLSNHPIYTSDSHVSVLTNGDKFYPKLLEKLRAAKEYIIMEFYIVKTDEIGKEVLEVLKEKAIEGLQVILMFDSLGSIGYNKKIMKSLEQSGVEVLQFDKVIFPLFNSKVNNRNHRKITVVDGECAFVGGMNLGDEYNHKSKRFGFWRDTHLMIEGPAINSSLEILNKDYYYITGRFFDIEKFACRTAVKSNGLVQTIQSGPDSHLPVIRNTYIKMINQARKNIKIMTPYLILDAEMLTALKTAAASDIKVDIIIPGRPDKSTIYKATESFIEQLVEHNVKVHKFSEKFVHAKILIIDDEIASCGTANLDIRSFLINFETTVLLTGGAVKHLVTDFEMDLSVSKEIDYEVWKNRSIVVRIVEGLVNIFAPLM